MQLVVAGMALSASKIGGVLLAGGAQMLAVYALIQALVETPDVERPDIKRSDIKRLEIPNVPLSAHHVVEEAATELGHGAKIDLEAVGLAARVQDDTFLNQVQVESNVAKRVVEACLVRICVKRPLAECIA